MRNRTRVQGPFTFAIARGLFTLLLVGCAAAAAFGQSQPSATDQLMLDDSLLGSTKGEQQGGTFGPTGWKTTALDDCILWHLPTIRQGAVEFSIQGLAPNECSAGVTVKDELFHMYDYTYGNSDQEYNGGYRENPYKHFMRKNNCNEGHVPSRTDGIEMLWATGNGNFTEPDTPNLSWDPNITYNFRTEWGPDGSGNTVFVTFRDGEEIMNVSLPGEYAPQGLSVRLAASTRGWPEEESAIGKVYSNVKVWNTSGTPITASAPPGGGLKPPPPPVTATSAGIAGVPGLPGTISTNPLLAGLSSSGGTTPPPQPPPVPPQYTTGGNSLSTYQNYAPTGGGSGSGGGGGGCWAGAGIGGGLPGYGMALLIAGIALCGARRAKAARRGD